MKTLNVFKLSFLIAVAAASLSVAPVSVRADGMVDDEPARPRRSQPAKVYTPPPAVVNEVAEPRAIKEEASILDEACEWKVRLSGGVVTWFFTEEDTISGPSGAIDFWRTDTPINYRIGVEGRHMDLEQDAADFAQEAPGKTTEITYIRIPISVEYMAPVAENVTWFVGGGPDLIRTANDISDFNVGLHLSTRLHYAFNEDWGTSLEAGYAWGDVDGEGGDVELDNAFVTPSLTYTF